MKDFATNFLRYVYDNCYVVYMAIVAVVASLFVMGIFGYIKETFMKNVLSSCIKNRDNNFNLIRFVAAVLVLYTHSYALATGTSKAEPLRGLLGTTWGLIAVDIFFITSGFLVTSSFLNRNNLIAFVWARFLRIYPALLVAVLFCAFPVGVFFTSLSMSEYFANAQLYTFIYKNSILVLDIEYALPGVFADIPFKHLVNGSLWTLPFELKMYAWLGGIGTCLVFLQKRISADIIRFVFLAIAIVSVSLYLLHRFSPFLSNGLFLHLFSMFFMGAAFYVWKDKVILSTKFFLIVLSILLLSILDQQFFIVIYNLSLAYLILYLAYVPSGKIRQFNAVGDYSYGIYIYAFPVQQSVAALIDGISIPTMIMVSFSITLLLAFFSWHLVEKKCLLMKDSYVGFEAKLKNLYLIFWRRG